MHNRILDLLVDEAENDELEILSKKREKDKKKSKLVEIKKENTLHFENSDSEHVVEEKEDLKQGVKLDGKKQNDTDENTE